MSKIRRPDLEVIPVSFPGYAASRLMPFYARPQVSGSIYFQRLKEDTSAQYGRDTASLAAITSHIIAADSTTFLCKELRDRVKMGYDQMLGYSDEEHADLALGRSGKRAWFSRLETDVAKLLLDAETPVDVVSDPIIGIDEQIASLQDLAVGDVVLAVSNRNFVALKANETLKDRMKNTGIMPGAGGDARYITAQQMAAALGVKEVIICSDREWYAAQDVADRGNAVLMVLPTQETDPNEEVQYGRTVYFEWETAADYFVMESYHDDDADANVVDAKGLIDLKVLNPELAKTLKVLA